MKQHRGISLGAVADMGPNAYLLTSGLAALLHVGFAHVDAGRIMRLYPRWLYLSGRSDRALSLWAWMQSSWSCAQGHLMDLRYSTMAVPDADIAAD